MTLSIGNHLKLDYNYKLLFSIWHLIMRKYVNYFNFVIIHLLVAINTNLTA